MRYKLELRPAAALAGPTDAVRRLPDLIPPGEVRLRGPEFAEGPPTMNTDDLEVVRKRDRVVRDPGLPLFATRDALIVGDTFAVIDKFSLVFSQFGSGVRPPDLQRYQQFKCGGDGQLWLEAEDADVERFSGRYVFAFWEPARMYHHWLLDCFPRALAAMQDPRLADAKLLLPQDAAGFVFASLDLAGVPRERIALYDPARVAEVEELLIIPIPRYDLEECGGAALSLLREKLLPKLPPSPYAGRDVIFSRRDALTGERLLINEDAVIAALQNEGAINIELTAHPIGEQFSIARDARTVFCVHGSAGANLLFCSPQTRVLHLFPDCVHYFYTHGIGTDVAGAKYGYLYGPSFQRRIRYHNNPWLLSAERVVGALQGDCNKTRWRRS